MENDNSHNDSMKTSEKSEGRKGSWSSLKHGDASEADVLDIDASVESPRWNKICIFCCPCAPEWVREEFPELFSLSWSMIVLSIFSFLQEPMSLAFCGHLGVNILAGVAIASTLINVAGLSVGIGLATACDTLFAQSFGSVNKRMVGVYLIRGMMIILLFSFPCWAIYLNVEHLLLALGQDPEISRIAGEYVLWFMPALPAVFVQELMMQYLRCQNILAPTMVIGAAGLGVCALAHYIFLNVLDYGYIGSAISQALSFYSSAILLILYTIISKAYKPTWGGLSIEVFYDWGAFLKLAVAGFLMIGLEWWCYEIGTILAGLLGPIELGAQSIAFQVTSMAYMLPLGVGLACNIRVGQLLGAEEPLRAKRVAKLGLTMTLFAGIVFALILAALSPFLPYIFSSDIGVIETASQVLLVVAVLAFFVSIGGVYTGIMRGCGRQAQGAAVILATYYAIGLPIGASLMFLTYLKVIGFYIGLCTGLLIEMSVFVFIVHRTNWEDQVNKAQERAGTADMTEEEKQALLGNDATPTRKGSRYTEEHFSDIESSGEDHGGGTRRRRRTSSMIYSPYVSSSQVNLVDPSLYKERPSRTMLVITRVLFVLFMVMLFVVGLLIRLSLPTPGSIRTNWTELCIPVNGTNSTILNTTLLFCNDTEVLIN